MEVKRYLDVVSNNGPVADTRKKLLAFYNVLPNHPDFESVTKEDFSEIKLRSQNERRTQKAPDISGLERFKSLGPPPPKESTSGNA